MSTRLGQLILAILALPALARAADAPAAPPPEIKVRAFPAPVERSERAGAERLARSKISAEQLADIEKRVRDQLPRLLAATVGISRESGDSGGQGSGVIVSAEGLILTAGHVSGTPQQEMSVYLSDGRKVRAKALGRNRTDDSGMMQILDDGPFPFVERGESGALARGEWVIALGHPGGWRRDRPAVLRVGRVNRVETWILTDAVLVGGDSGGPLFSLDGKLVGIHSRIGNSTSANMHVPIDKFAPDWERLAAGEEWNQMGGLTRMFAGAPWLGIDIEPAEEADGHPVGLRVTVVEQSGPAAAAGLKAGDVITHFNDRPVEDRGGLVELVAQLRVGDTARLEVIRDGGETTTLRVRLGRRPSESR